MANPRLHRIFTLSLTWTSDSTRIALRKLPQLQYHTSLSSLSKDAMSISVPMPTQGIEPRLRVPAAFWHHPAFQVSVLLLWGTVLFLYGIHQGDLYRTEGLRAIIGKEMHRTGDWLVPRLYGEPILTKPPMFYWAIAATGHVFGEVTTWSSRLPAALAGLGCLLVVYFTLRRYSPSQSWLPLLGAMALPCSGMWLEKSSSAEIDTLLVLWVLGAWACFLHVIVPLSKGKLEGVAKNPEARSQKPEDEYPYSGSWILAPGFWWFATLLCVAGGVLTKWTGFLYFYAMAIPLLLWHRQLWRLFHWHHLLAATLGVLVVLCWLGPVVYELGWSQVSGMLWKEGAPRVLHGKNASQQLILETAIHPWKVIGIAAPWSIMVLWGLWQLSKRRNSRTSDVPSRESTPRSGYRPECGTVLEQSLVCWAVAGTFMMTVFPDHNIRQSFSLVPAWTLLGVLTLRRLWQVGALPNWCRPQRTILILMLLWLVLKIVHVEVLIPARFRERPSLDEQSAIISGFVPTGETLYLVRVKDECLFFNYPRVTRRLASWDRLPGAGVVHCVLTEEERKELAVRWAGSLIREQELLDAQGERLYLVTLDQGRI
jgi:hypothetical protein